MGNVLLEDIHDKGGPGHDDEARDNGDCDERFQVEFVGGSAGDHPEEYVRYYRTLVELGTL